MAQGAELQPFKVAAADIGNRLQRQSLDLGAAMFPLQVQQLELANKAKGVQIVGEGLSNQIKSDELGDAAELAKTQAAWQRGENYSPVFSTKTGLAAHEMWKGSLDLEKANRAEWAAFTTGMAEVATLNPALVPTLKESLKDGKPTSVTFALLDQNLPVLRQQKAEQDRANKLALFTDEQKAITDRQKAVVDEKGLYQLLRGPNGKPAETEQEYINKRIEQHMRQNPNLTTAQAVDELRYAFKLAADPENAGDAPPEVPRTKDTTPAAKTQRARDLFQAEIKATANANKPGVDEETKRVNNAAAVRFRSERLQIEEELKQGAKPKPPEKPATGASRFTVEVVK